MAVATNGFIYMPDPVSLAAPALERHLQSQREDRPTALGTELRGSFSGMCSRRIAFEVVGAEKDYDLDGATLATFEVGNQWHIVTQEAYEQVYGAESEVVVDLRPHGFDLSGHADLLFDHPTAGRTVGEIKSTSEFGFLKAVGGTSKYGKPVEAEGPKEDHVIQAAIYAIGLDAEAIHIIYFNKAKTGEMAEWTLPLDKPWMPTQDGQRSLSIRQVAVAEMQRMQHIVELLDKGVLAERWHPQNGLVSTVPKHMQDNEGRWPKPHWYCGGCPFNKTCAALPAGNVTNWNKDN